jgi:hypothetical protein
MKKLIQTFAIFLVSFLAVFAASAQTPATSPAPSSQEIGITPTLALGDVTAVDAASKTMMLKTKDGDIIVLLSDTTAYKRVPPGEKTLTNATPITLQEVGVGDRVIAMGKVADDKKSVTAKQVILMTKADIAKKQEREREEWRRRGVAGRVTSLNATSKEITISVRSLTGETSVTIVDTAKATFRRYTPDSVKFSDAKPSTFFDLRVGDQLRALGTKGADGTKFTPEEIVSGSFRTVAGTITAIDATTGEIQIKNLQTEKPMTIVVGKDAMLRRLPQMGMFGGGGPGGPGGGQGGSGGQMIMRPQQSGQGGQGGPGQGGQGGPGQGGMRMNGGGPDFDEMIERWPAVTLAELKVGDMIGASSSAGADPNRVVAIKLLAGIEPFIRMQQMQQAQRQGQNQISSPSLNLPGLDSIGIP